MGLIEDEAMEVRCRLRADDVTLPRQGTLESLVQAVAEHTGYDIALKPLTSNFRPGVSAVVTLTPTGFELHRVPGDDQTWTTLCVAHELGHILCEHLTHPVVSSVAATRPPDAPQGTDSTLRPTRTQMFRCGLADDLEQEAELTGTFLAQRFLGLTDRRRAHVSRSAADGGDMRRRYMEVLNNSRDGKRR